MAKKKTSRRAPQRKKAARKGKKKSGDLIISKSRTKQAAKIQVSGDFYGALDNAVRDLIDTAEKKALRGGRKTLRPFDLSGRRAKPKQGISGQPELPSKIELAGEPEGEGGYVKTDAVEEFLFGISERLQALSSYVEERVQSASENQDEVDRLLAMLKAEK